MWVRGEKGSPDKAHTGMGFPRHALGCSVTEKGASLSDPQIWLHFCCAKVPLVTSPTLDQAATCFQTSKWEPQQCPKKPWLVALGVSCSSGSCPSCPSPGSDSPSSANCLQLISVRCRPRSQLGSEMHMSGGLRRSSMRFPSPRRAAFTVRALPAILPAIRWCLIAAQAPRLWLRMRCWKLMLVTRAS